MATQKELRAASLTLDRLLLSQSAQELVDIDHGIDALQQQIADIMLNLITAQRRRADASMHHDQLQQHVRSQEREISPFSACPEDLLRTIFCSLAADPDTMWPAPTPSSVIGLGTWNGDRAKAPFTLAAVSRRWRSAALTCRRMWDYVGITSLANSGDRVICFVAHVELVLARSGASPLDILFERLDDSTLPAYTDLLTALYANISRWRRFYIHCLQDFPNLLYFFRGPAPLLENICVICDLFGPVDWPTSFSETLAECSRLQALHIYNAPCGVDTLRHRFPMLQNVHITHRDMPPPLFWGSFSHASNLRSLTLDIADASAVGVPPECTLPSLLMLVLFNDAVRLAVVFPAIFGLKNTLFDWSLAFRPGRPLVYSTSSPS